MNHSTPGLPVHHQLPEFTQTHAHRVGDAIQPSHPLSSPSPPAPNPSQHQGLFQWVNSSHEVAEVLEQRGQSVWNVPAISTMATRCQPFTICCRMAFSMGINLLQQPTPANGPLCRKVKWVKSLSCVQLFAAPWTVAYQAPPSMGRILECVAISLCRKALYFIE